jgi:hypothetical protein
MPEPVVFVISDKLKVKCVKCDHQAGSHNLATGKHECFVYGCDCHWFKIPKEIIDDK